MVILSFENVLFVMFCLDKITFGFVWFFIDLFVLYGCVLYYMLVFWYCMALFGTLLFCLLLYWYCMVLFSTEWFCLVLYGFV